MARGGFGKMPAGRMTGGAKGGRLAPPPKKNAGSMAFAPKKQPPIPAAPPDKPVIGPSTPQVTTFGPPAGAMTMKAGAKKPAKSAVPKPFKKK